MAKQSYSPLNLSAISVRRKIAVSCLIIALVLLGLNSYRKIGIDILPKFDVPYVQITAVYPGASPEEIETEVARRIEDAVSSLDGLKHTTTICMENAAAITLEFELGTDVDLKLHDVREKLNRIADEFPAGVETPRLSKLDVNSVPVATLYLCGDRTTDDLYDFVDDKLADSFATLPGVGEVRIHGGNEMQLHVIPRRDRLAECGITLPELVEKIKKNHLKLPVGKIKRADSEITLTYDAEFKTPGALGEMEITGRDGKRVHLRDIAEIKLMSKETRQLASIDGKPGIQLEIVKKADANTVKVIDEIRQRYDQLRNTPGMLPGGMELIWFKDSGEFIRASVNDAWMSVVIGILLTAATLFAFLHKLRPTLIIVITLPVSFIISFLVLKARGYTFDMMTLVSLGCASGVLVDNSIVVLESIFSHLSRGENKENAVVNGTSKVANALLASSLTNVVVFLPIAAMTSVAGLIVGPFAGVMVIVTFISIFITFTLTSILGARFLRDPGKEKKSRFSAIWNKYYNRVAAAFIWSIKKVRRHPGSVALAIILLCAGLLAWCLPRISVSFLPPTDQGELTLTLEFPAASSLQANEKRVQEIVAELKKLPYVQSVGATTGYRRATTGQLAEGVYLAGVTIKLVPRDQRAPIEDLRNDIRKNLDQYHDLKYNLAIPVISGSSGADLTAYITGPDPAELDRFAELGAQILRESGIATDIDTTVRPGKPRIFLHPDRPVLQNLQLDAATVGYEAVGFFDGIEAGSYKVGSRSYDIRVKTGEAEGMASVQNLVVGKKDGHPLNLETVVTQESDPVQLSIRRQDKERCAWIYANPAKGESLGALMNVLKEKLEPQLPTGYKLAFFGQAELLSDGVREFKEAFLIATILIYLVIAAILESWTKPFLILFTIPLGFVGLFVILDITHTPFSIVGMLGAIMMIGIVVNNAILLMDETNVQMKRNISPGEAMLLACRRKFRAILMTSLTSIIGILPMAFGTGLGSEIRSSCGIGVVGGLLFSTGLTLYLIPAIFFWWQEKVRRKK